MNDDTARQDRANSGGPAGDAGRELPGTGGASPRDSGTPHSGNGLLGDDAAAWLPQVGEPGAAQAGEQGTPRAGEIGMSVHAGQADEPDSPRMPVDSQPKAAEGARADDDADGDDAVADSSWHGPKPVGVAHPMTGTDGASGTAEADPPLVADGDAAATAPESEASNAPAETLAAAGTAQSPGSSPEATAPARRAWRTRSLAAAGVAGLAIGGLLGSGLAVAFTDGGQERGAQTESHVPGAGHFGPHEGSQQGHMPGSESSASDQESGTPDQEQSDGTQPADGTQSDDSQSEEG